MTENQATARHESCAFCGREKTDVPTLIRGPGVYICSECVTICQTCLQNPDFSGTNDKELVCSFCGVKQAQAKVLIPGPSVYICDACVHLCEEILNDQSDRETQLH